jgi:hypothetical protein
MTEPVQPTGSAPPPPPPPTPPAEPKKKRSPLLWIAVGCAAIVVIAAVVVIGGGIFAAKKAADYVEDLADDPQAAAMMVAENIVRLNPELELVDSDKDAGTLTIRNKESGEVVTLDLDDVQEGRIQFEGEGGEVTTIGVEEDGEEGGGIFSIKKDGEETFRIGKSEDGKLPEWIPAFPGADVEELFSMVSDGTRTGAFTVSTSGSIDELLTFYEGQFDESDGWKVSRTDISAGGMKGGQVTIENAERMLSMTVNATPSTGDGAQAAVNYSSTE